MLRHRLLLGVIVTLALALAFGGPLLRPPRAQAADTYSRSYSFSTVNGAGGWVAVTDSPDLTPASALTIEAWIRPEGTPDCHTVVSKNFQTSFWFGLCQRKIRLESNGGPSGVNGPTTIPENVWTHIAVTWQKDGQRRYYLNGDLDFAGAAGPAPSANGSPLYIGANPPGGSYPWRGNIAEVRLWNVVRSQDDIRRTMHVALDERLPGLVANWHLTDHTRDVTGTHHGSAGGGAASPSLTAVPAPPRPAVAPVDTEFNRLSQRLTTMAAAYVPRLNRLIMVGGVIDSVVNNQVRSLDPGDGRTVTLASTLPNPVFAAAAAYAPGTDLVYVFGGSPNVGGTNPLDTILAVNPETGAARTLAAKLPTGIMGAAAAYHSATGKIYLLGGTNAADLLAPNALTTAYVFDPTTETIAPAGFSLPDARFWHTAVASSLNDRIYIFGGQASLLGVGEASIVELRIERDGTASVQRLPAPTLPEANSRFAAVEDPISGLIYLLGGPRINRVLAFDPATDQLWQTPVLLLAERSNAAAVYDRANRHILLTGGSEAGTARESVWRIQLGDGPAVALGRWDFPVAAGSNVTSIHGDESGVAIGTESTGVGLFGPNAAPVTYTELVNRGEATRSVRFDPILNRLWFLGRLTAVMRDFSGTLSPVRIIPVANMSLSEFWSMDFVNGYSVHVDEIRNDPDFQMFFGVSDNVGSGEFATKKGRLVSRAYAGAGFFSNPVWMQRLVTLGLPAFNVPIAIAHRDYGDVWSISSDRRLRRLEYYAFARPTNIIGETDTYGTPCNFWGFQDMAWGTNGELWLVSIGTFGVQNSAGICRALNLPGAPVYNSTETPGPLAWSVSRDLDGRVWVARGPSGLLPGGGLSAFESVIQTKELRTGDWNWQNAPIGSRVLQGAAWESLLRKVGAVDERVWAGGTDGRLITLAQRWQQLDQQNDLRSRVINKVFPVRGRVFLAGSAATGGGLFVLQPDGLSWDNRNGVQVLSVHGDRRGRIWVGTDQGLRRYLSSGWDLLANVPGPAPTGPVRAITEDQNGRLWIGGDNGLTLLDRERFVTTFTSANSALPSTKIKALVVDRENRLWAGTDAGVARLDGAVFTLVNTGLPSNDVSDLAVLRTGQVVVSTAGGTAIFNGTQFVKEGSTPNAPVSVDEQGRLWLGASVKNGGSYQSYYWTNSGLQHSTISDVAADGAGRVWFAHAPNTGVSVRGAYLAPLPEVIPTLTGLSPDSGHVGDVVTISGSGFGRAREDVEVRIGGKPVEIQSLADTAITVRIGADTTSGDLTVRRLRRTVTLTKADRPAFCAVPWNISFTPRGGNVGVPVAITGSNFDPNTSVSLGGPARRPAVSPTRITLPIRPGDAPGSVTVRNDTPGCGGPTATQAGFNVVTPKIELIELNQGLPSVPLVADKPTLMRLYVSAPGKRPEDVLQADQIRVDQRDPATGAIGTRLIPFTSTVAVPTIAGPPSPGDIGNIYQSLFGVFYPYAFPETTAVLRRGGFDVATASRRFDLQGSQVQTVLLVPIMRAGYTPADVQRLKQGVEPGLADLRERMMPFGRVVTSWTADVVTRPGPVRIDNADEHKRMMVELHRIRRNWHSVVGGTGAYVVGMLDPALKDPNDTASGRSAIPITGIDAFGRDVVETLCDVGTGLLSVVTFGIADITDECEMDLPRMAVWSSDVTAGPNSRVSHTIAHELGHSFNVVNHDAPNYESDMVDLNDSWDYHSLYDEIENGMLCNLTATKGTPRFHVGYTMYSPGQGATSPIVNPLLPTATMQITSNILPAGTPDATQINQLRAKSILSYACNKQDSNTFFEQWDHATIRGNYHLFGDAGQEDLVGTSIRASEQPALNPKPIAGERLAVTGFFTPTAGTGSIEEVRAVGDSGRISPSFVNEYVLVQVDASDRELARTGLPRFVDHLHTPPPTGGGARVETFAATIVRQPGLAALQLRQSEQVLASYRAGGGAPIVSITSPAGGSYSGGAVPVTWTASDPDGDPVQIAVYYSRDAGATWKPAGFASGSGTLNLFAAQLGGSADARIRVTASDGFNSASAVSGAFSVAAQPPLPFISLPAGGSSWLESIPGILAGSAEDAQDGAVADAGLRWVSSRDGVLGSGARLQTALSGGLHVITLTATNAAGLQASAAVTVNVTGDYDGDGLTDAEEARLGLSVLDSQDVRRDASGLPLIVKLRLGLDLNQADTDGDGRSDVDELANGSDPTVQDQPREPDRLSVAPAAVELTYNPIVPGTAPQKLLMISSRQPVSWTATTSVPWLRLERDSGTTLDSIVAVVDVKQLPAGGGVGSVTFSSPSFADAVSVPVTVTTAVRRAAGARVISLPIILLGTASGW